jgi:integrase/recombinase XerD
MPYQTLQQPLALTTSVIHSIQPSSVYAGAKQTEEISITLDVLQVWAEEYFRDCELRLFSPNTIAIRRIFIQNLLWFLHEKGYSKCDTLALRQFFYYLNHGHEEPGGRFGLPHLNKPVRPVTVKDYYRTLRTLFKWLVSQGVLPETPFAYIPAPIVRDEVKTPLVSKQIEALLQAAKDSREPLRNKAILLFLLDTGCRVSEVLSITLGDMDFTNGCCRVLGKGGKYRTIYFGKKVKQALSPYIFHYLKRLNVPNTGTRNEISIVPENTQSWPLFYSGRLPSKKTMSVDNSFVPQPFSRWGLLRLIKRLGSFAGIQDACSVHALRRTFAVQMLRNGANVFSVQAMLGHSDLGQTRQYCAIALTDVEAQHRAYSPADRLRHSISSDGC